MQEMNISCVVGPRKITSRKKRKQKLPQLLQLKQMDGALRWKERVILDTRMEAWEAHVEESKELGIAPMAWETFKRWTIAEEHFEKGNKNES